MISITPRSGERAIAAASLVVLGGVLASYGARCIVEPGDGA